MIVEVYIYKKIKKKKRPLPLIPFSVKKYHKNKYLDRQVKILQRIFQMVTIVLYLHMDKQELVKHIQ